MVNRVLLQLESLWSSLVGHFKLFIAFWHLRFLWGMYSSTLTRCYVFYFNAARESRTGAWVRLSTQEGKQIFVYSTCVFLLFLCAPGVSHDITLQCNIRSHNKHFFFVFIAALLVTVYHKPAYDDDRHAFTKNFSFFCISEGEDCERNRDADHSAKSKKIHLNVAKKKNLFN